MEKEKLWEFSVDKSKWMCIKNNKSEAIEDIGVEVKQGMIAQIQEYKYLGNWTNEKGNLDTQLQHMKTKAKDIVRQGNITCSREKVGRMEITAKLFIYVHLAVPAIFFNIEVWSNLRQQDKDQLEVIQGITLKGLLGLPKATPYWGILYELQILPVNLLLLYKKLMVYHMLMNSDPHRIARKIVEEQERSNLENCWFADLKTEAKEIGIEIEKRKVDNVSKSSWKKYVKNKIKKSFDQECKIKLGNMTKLRFLNSPATENYMNYLYNDEARDALKIRLNMVEAVTNNFHAYSSCLLCGHKDDTTEHVFECGALGDHGLSVENLQQGTEMRGVVQLFNKMEMQKRDMLIDNIMTNFNVIQREEWGLMK